MNVEVGEPVDPLKVKCLEHNTAGEQAVDVRRLTDVDVIEQEPFELGEKKHGVGMNLGQIASRNADNAQRGRAAERGEREGAHHCSSIKSEVLDAR